MDTSDQSNSAREVVFSRKAGWIPNVIRKNGLLYLELGAGADANHEPRTFSFLINEDHLVVIKESLARHLLLWAAVLPICEEAGTNNYFNDEAAMALLDPILFGSEAAVELLFQENNWDTRLLVAHNADIELLEQGKLFAALKTATPETDSKRAAEYTANQDRAKRGIVLSPLDEAILRYANQYIYRSNIPSRHPDEVDPKLLPEVLAVIATGEQASAGMELSPNKTAGKIYQINKQEWNTIRDTVTAAITKAYPTLSTDTVATISYLLCSEASSRARKASI